MPRETELDWWAEDWWAEYQASGGNASGRIRALCAEHGIYPPSGAPEEPATFQETWDRKSVMLTTADGKTKQVKIVTPATAAELEKHLHNPRGLGLPTCPPLSFFKKNLPDIGSVSWLRLSDMYDWDPSFCTPIRVLQNDEQTVYVESSFGICGYLCTCCWCKKAWKYNETPRMLEEHRYQFRHVTPEAGGWTRMYYGHLGAILRACHLGLPQSLGVIPASWADVNHAAPRGVLKLNRNCTEAPPEYAVPEFVEERTMTTPSWYANEDPRSRFEF